MVNTDSRNHEFLLNYQEPNMQFLEKIVNFVPWLCNQLSKSTYQTEIEQYIAARRPQNAADVEFLTREYQHRNYSKGWL